MGRAELPAPTPALARNKLPKKQKQSILLPTATWRGEYGAAAGCCV
jgi:hypothetical protein